MPLRLESVGRPEISPHGDGQLWPFLSLESRWLQGWQSPNKFFASPMQLLISSSPHLLSFSTPEHAQ
jgi:hypothetical protein